VARNGNYATCMHRLASSPPRRRKPRERESNASIRSLEQGDLSSPDFQIARSPISFAKDRPSDFFRAQYAENEGESDRKSRFRASRNEPRQSEGLGKSERLVEAVSRLAGISEFRERARLLREDPRLASLHRVSVAQATPSVTQFAYVRVARDRRRKVTRFQ